MLELDSQVEAEGKRAAQAFRSRHGLGEGPIKDVADLVQATVNADVALVNFDQSLAAMICVDKQDETTLIAVGTTDNPERQRFSIAHELGHYVFNEFADNLNDEDDTAIEDRAHAFARHLLLPDAALSDFLTDRGYEKLALPERALSHVVALFEVSGTVAAIQLHESRWIDDETFEAWQNVEASYLAQRYGWAAERRARVIEAQTERPPRRMMDNATEAYVEHYLDIKTLAHLDGSATADELSRTLKNSGIVPRMVIATPVDLDSFGDAE